MSEDIIKPSGPTKRSSPTAGGANPRLAPILGIVKDNVDPTRSGKIMVYISDNSGNDPENKNNWRPVRYLSPFFGFTRPDAPNDALGKYKTNPSSYGMWNAPPDIGTTVVCIFINGDMNYGFYIGCVPEPEALQMVPAIGAGDNVIPNSAEAASYGGAVRLPVTNINTNNKNVADSPDYLVAPKPVHSYTSAIMFQQGVIRDPIRGPISTSAQRETPSRVGWGISTPGRPIYEGGFDDKTIAENLEPEKAKQLRVVSRRGGHSIIMDDGDVIGRDNLIRIRTALGHQILMSDDGQTLMLLHSNGQSYIELGKEGTVDIFSTNSVNVRTAGDLNFHADNNVNIHATKDVNIQGDNIHINSEKEYKQRVGSNYSNFTKGTHLTKVTGAMSMESAGDISMASSAQAYVNGSKVLLNSGQTSTKPKEVSAIDKVLHTDTLFDQEKGWIAAPSKLVSITSRTPAHAPWANAGQGVDVKTNLNASSELPQSASSSVAATNSRAEATVTSPVQNSTISSVPSSSQVSNNISGDTTKALTATVAQNAVEGPTSLATNLGTTVTQTAQGAIVGVGQFAQTPQQLETAGIIKPGSAALVNSIAATTGNVQAALTNNMFTGQPGAENLSTFVNNLPAQTESVVKNLQVAQTNLQNAGIITGQESPTQIGGLVMSTAQNGLDSTLSAVQSSALNVPISNLNNIGQTTQGQANKALKDIGSGNFASKIADSARGALGGLQSSVSALAKSPSLAQVIDQSKGIAASAFNAIKAAFGNLTPNQPQSLKAATRQSARNTAESTLSTNNQTNQARNILGSAVNTADINANLSNIDSGVQTSSQNVLSSTNSVADSLVNAGTSGRNSIGSVTQTQLSDVNNYVEKTTAAFADTTSLIRNSSGSLNELQSAASSVTGGASSLSTSLASGVTNLPGGQGAISNVVNKAKDQLALPNAGELTNLINDSASKALNGLNVPNIATPISAFATAGLPTGALAQLQSAVGSIATGGSGIKVPSIGINTTNRAEITAQVEAVLEDPAIPKPDLLGEIKEETVGKIENIEERRLSFKEENERLSKEYADIKTKADTEYGLFLFLRDSRPQGDPAVEISRKKALALLKQAQQAGIKLQELHKQFPELSVNASYSTETKSSSTTSGTPNTTSVT
jgi:hypothetical protein